MKKLGYAVLSFLIAGAVAPLSALANTYPYSYPNSSIYTYSPIFQNVPTYGNYGGYGGYGNYGSAGMGGFGYSGLGYAGYSGGCGGGFDIGIGCNYYGFGNPYTGYQYYNPYSAYGANSGYGGYGAARYGIGGNGGYVYGGYGGYSGFPGGINSPGIVTIVNGTPL